MANNLIDQSLKFSKEQSVPVKIALRDGRTVAIRVKDFDGYVVLVAGEPDYLLYRHSIFNVDGGAGHRPAKARPERKPKPKTTGKPRRKPHTPDKTEKRPSLKNKEGQSFANPMADQIKKWLDSQKDGE